MPLDVMVFPFTSDIMHKALQGYSNNNMVILTSEEIYVFLAQGAFHDFNPSCTQLALSYLPFDVSTPVIIHRDQS